MTGRIALSQTDTGKAWLAQFASGNDAEVAARLLDAMLLLSDTDIADAIRDAVYDLVRNWQDRRRFLGLYAEREFDATTAYESVDTPDSKGRIRKRAVHYAGAVKPTRGKTRVGSEGTIAYIISQLVEKYPKSLKNHPSPKRIRAKSSPVGAIVIVTDLIGSGTRVKTMLDKFWHVPSVKSWVSAKWIEFIVVAAAGTKGGIAHVRSHRLRPTVIAQLIVPTIETWRDQTLANEWRRLISNYGPITGRGGGARAGYGKSAALVALSSRIPNNTPAILHKSGGPGWRALYTGAAPYDLRTLFRMHDEAEQAKSAAELIGVRLADDLNATDSKLVVVLSIAPSLLRRGDIEAIAAITRLSRREVDGIFEQAVRTGLLTSDGRLTEEGQAFLKANRSVDRRRPTIATNIEPYYPQKLRIPRVNI